MKRPVLLVLLVVGLALTMDYVALAVPAAPVIHTLTQPDGTRFRARLMGDEWYHWWQTPDGRVIARDARTGRWAPSVRPPRPAQSTRWRGVPRRAMRRVPTGDAAVPVMCVNFTNTTTMFTPSQFSGALFGSSGATFRTCYTENSYGQFTVNPGPAGVTGWYAAANQHDYYGNDYDWTGDRVRALVLGVVQAADAAGVDFSPYDRDGDGTVETVCIIHQGEGCEASGNGGDIWSHSWDLATPYLTKSGKYVSHYVIQPEQLWGGMSTVGVFCHEYGHSLGLPDLYDTDYSSEGIGQFSLMAGGSWNGPQGMGDVPSQLDAWCKSFLGWVTPTVVALDQANAAIPKVETSPTVYKLWAKGTAGTEYFLVENRELTGFDAYLPGSGLAIWHVDDTQMSNDNEWYPGHTSSGNYWVALEQADGQWGIEQGANQGDPGDLYPGTMGNHTFDATSTPNSHPYDGSKAFIGVKNISSTGDTMHADLITGITLTHQPDAYVRNPDPDTYLGGGTINTTGLDQTKTQKVNQSVKATYFVKVKNTGSATDDITITGPAASTGWTVQYFDALTGGNNKTTDVTGTGWTLTNVAADASFEFRVEVTPGSSVAQGTAQNVLVTARSAKDTTKADAVLATTTRTTQRPDMLIRKSSETNYFGGMVYNTDGTNQTKTQPAAAGMAAVFCFQVKNNGDADQLKVTGTAGQAGAWTVQYFDALSGGNDITADITGSGRLTGSMANGDTREWRVEVTPDASLSSGASVNVLVTGTSMTDATRADTVKAVTNLVIYKPDALVKNSTDTDYLGGGTINATGVGQAKSQRLQAGATAIYHLKLQNDGDTDDTFTVTGTPGGTGWTVKYFDAVTGGTERTGDIGGTGWTSGVVAHGAAMYLRAEVKPGGAVSLGDSKDLLVKAVSVGNATKSDTVKASTMLVGPTASPVLSWVGTTGYGSDGVDPDTAAAGTVFTFRVRLTDTDGGEPDWVHLLLTRNGVDFSTLTMAPATSPASPTITGRIYQARKRLYAGNYTYRFAAQDGDGPATGSPTTAKVGPVMPTTPFLTWAGTAGFKAGGVTPGAGRADKTVLQFEVKYNAFDGDRPTAVRVLLKRNKRSFGTFNMTFMRGSDAVTGMVYGFSRKLPAGTYTYLFQATDRHGSASGPAAKTMGGPDLTSGAASVLSALAAAPTRAGGAQITFSLTASATVTAQVLNVAGRPVATVTRGKAFEEGVQTLLWSGRNDTGVAVPSGVYLLNVEALSADGTTTRHVAVVNIAR